MKSTFTICFFLFTLTALAQLTKLDLGMRRNAVQTLMGTAKLDTYKKDKSIYAFADSVFFTIKFDEEDYCEGFYFSGKNEAALEKTIIETGFTKNDVAYTAKGFRGYFKREEDNADIVYRFMPTLSAQTDAKELKPLAEEVPKEKPFYGFSILGYKVWEKKEK